MGKTSKSTKRSKPAKGSIGKSTTMKTKSYATPAKKAKISAARMVANAVSMGFMGIRKKFLDTAKADGAIAINTDLTGGEYDPSTGCTGCLSCPAQGDTEQSRDGKRFVIDSLILKGHVALTESASTAVFDSAKVFVAVVLDTQTNGAQLSSEDVFKSLGNAAPLNVNVTKNLLFGDRFRILKSQVYDLTPPGPAPAGLIAFCSPRRDFDWYIPFKGGLTVNLNAGTTANVTNVIDNSLHVVAFATVAGTTMAYNARIRFQG